MISFTRSVSITCLILFKYFLIASVILIQLTKRKMRMSQNSLQALSILRDPSQFKWYVIPLFLIVIYVYMVEIEKKNWKAVFAGLSFWGMDWFNEIWNALFFYFNKTAPVWGAPKDTAFLILIGLNIEISFMFLIMGIVATKVLPADRNIKILGVNNRLFYAVLNSILCVIVEIVLNLAGWLTWEHSWWSVSMPFLIFIFGYFPFFAVSYFVYDLGSIKKQAVVTFGILLFDIACLVVFGPVLHWI